MTGTAAPTFPRVNLNTERLELRGFTIADVDDVLAGAADPETQRWLPLPAPGEPYTRADAERWCREQAPACRASGEGIQWAAVLRDGGMFVGSFGLTRTLWNAASTEVGYWVGPWARGCGLASEAVAAIARWTLKEQRFQRLTLKAAPGNHASRRVAERNGFVYEGIERNAMPLHRGRTDLALYSLIPSDLDSGA